MFRLERYGIWGMARHAEVFAALNDWQTFISGAGAGIQNLKKEKAWRPQSIVLEADPPLHDQTRGVLSAACCRARLCGSCVRPSRRRPNGWWTNLSRAAASMPSPILPFPIR